MLYTDIFIILVFQLRICVITECMYLIKVGSESGALDPRAWVPPCMTISDPQKYFPISQKQVVNPK